MKTAFLILTHYITPRIEKLIKRAESGLSADIFVIGYFSVRDDVPEELKCRDNFIAYTASDIVNENYPVKGRSKPFKLIAGNVDLIILRFAQDNPHYDVIWSWEGDADFTGNLNDFCSYFDAIDADLFAAHIDWRRKDWPNFSASHVPVGWPNDWSWPFSGLLPVLRVNRLLLEKIAEFYESGGDGHYEWSWFYVARVCGFTFEDFGGSGPFVRPEHINRFYTPPRCLGTLPGTFKYYPTFERPGHQPNKLFHPIKDRPISPIRRLYRYFRGIRLEINRWLSGKYRRDRSAFAKYIHFDN